MSDHLIRKKYSQIPGLEFNFPEENFYQFFTNDGLKLHTYRYRSKSPRCLVIIFHGLHSYSNNQAILGKYLSDIGCDVISFDQRGHGKSEGVQAFLPSFEHLLDDSCKFVREISLLYKSFPIYVNGGSMGGTLAIAISIELPHIIKGIICFNPAIGGQIKCEKFLRCFLGCIGKCCGKLKVYGGSNKKWAEDDALVEYLYENPFMYTGWVRIGTLSSVDRLMRFVRERAEIVKCDILVVIGLRDNVVNPKETERFYNRVPGANKELWMYDDINHGIVFDKNIYRVCARVCDWISKRLD